MEADAASAMDPALAAGAMLLGEGGANVVVSTQQGGRCLRVAKQIKEGGKARYGTRENHAFAAGAMRPLLGAEYVRPGALVAAPPPFLTALAAAIEQQRDAKRVKDGGVDVSAGHALQLRDWTRPLGGSAPGCCVCVELKPKDGRAPERGAASRYLRMQRQKLSQGKVAALSAYEPADLFSGERPRMSKALAALLATPQNNLALFRDGARADPRAGAGAEQLGAAAALEGLFPGDADAERLLVGVLAVVLQREPVLARLLAAQRLDQAGVVAVCQRADAAQGGAAAVEGARLEAVTKRAGLHAKSLAESAQPAPTGSAADDVCDFLLSTTACDCSIMIALQRCAADAAADGEGEGSGRVSGADVGLSGAEATLAWRYELGVVDLDAKSPDNLPSYLRTESALEDFA